MRKSILLRGRRYLLIWLLVATALLSGFATAQQEEGIDQVCEIRPEVAETIFINGSVGDGLAVSPDGQFLYVPTGPGYVSIIDLSSYSVRELIEGVGSSPTDIAITPDGKQLYVTTEGDRERDIPGRVSVIDTESNKVIATIAGGQGVCLIEISEDGSRAYVGNVDSDNILVIDTQEYRVADTIAIRFPMGMALTSDQQFLYVCSGYRDSKAGNLLKLDIETHEVVIDIEFELNPWKIALTPDGQYAYVTLYHGYRRGNPMPGSIKALAVIDTTSDQVVNRIDTGANPDGVVVSPGGRFVYVANKYSVSVIDTESQEVITSIEPASLFTYDLAAIAVAPDGSQIYVAGYSNTVTVINTNLPPGC